MKRLLIIIFILILVLPLFVTIFGLDKQFKTQENRDLVELPKLNVSRLQDYPTQFVNYFNDNFGLRTILVQTNNTIKLKYLKSSTHSQVTLGKKDWLFYTPEENYKEVLNLQPFNATELEQIQTNLEQINSHFNELGIKFYFLVAPASQTIYPEYLPDYLKKINPNSKLEQLSSYLAQKQSKVKLINPTYDLINSKSQGQIYYRHDLHWNSLGAYIAYNTLMQEIKKDFPTLLPNSLDKFNITYQKSPQKDLEHLLGVNDFYQEEEPVLALKSGFKAQTTGGDCKNIYMRCGKLLTQINDSKLPKLVMFRDSYGSWLTPFFSEHFQKSTYLWVVRPYSIEKAIKEDADIVILELTERELSTLTGEIFNFN